MTITLYKVMTMCHCGDSVNCDDHWAVGIPKSGYNARTGMVRVASDMTDGFRTKADAQLFADAKNKSELRRRAKA